MAKTKLTPRPHFRLHIKHGVAIGPGKAQLLGQIAELGSITAAGRAMGMAYRTAWLLVDSMNEHFKEPLVLSTRGGASGGGAALTPLGQEVLSCYVRMEQRALKAIAKDVEHLESLIRR